MNSHDQVLFDKLKELSPQRVAQVEDFVDFLQAREQRKVAAEPLSDECATLGAVGLPEIAEDEVEETIQASGQARRDSIGKN